MPLRSQYSHSSTSSMLTILRCSWSAASFKTFLKVGETRRFKVSLLVSVNRIDWCHAIVCAVALVYIHPAFFTLQIFRKFQHPRRGRITNIVTGHFSNRSQTLIRRCQRNHDRAPYVQAPLPDRRQPKRNHDSVTLASQNRLQSMAASASSTTSSYSIW